MLRPVCRTMLVVFSVAAAFLPSVRGTEVLEIEAALVHLRADGPREWATFAKSPDGERLERTFEATPNDDSWTLSLRQQDVKQTWEVQLNGNSLGTLTRDENDLRHDFEVPPAAIIDGVNTLTIRQTTPGDADDIRVGQIRLHPVDRKTLRHAVTLEITLVDGNTRPIPGRITIVDEQGTLIPVGAESGAGLAVREGVVYTSTGVASFGVAPGQYRIFGGRGFEYSVEQVDVSVTAADTIRKTLTLRREVETNGWVACDTHVHTLTHSGHGDCSIEERMVTLAGEGIELPIATDHNKQIDYRPTAAKVGVAAWFTPVIGNEVTTKNGHFNIFPAAADAPPPDHSQTDWDLLFDDIYSTPDVRVAILNHARDIHGGFRPFSSRHHVSLTGENLDARTYHVTAMEVINSGATQTDSQELFRDWCGLINRGLLVTPVGSSDSHDVARYIVGQGRTYIDIDDTDVARIDVEQAVNAFLIGRVVVSYGLFARLVVESSAGRMPQGPGDMLMLTDRDEHIELTAFVQGPSWTRADRVTLLVCGEPRFSEAIAPTAPDELGLQSRHTWQIPRSELTHDIWVTVTAEGPGVTATYWPFAKPYQPDSPAFTPRAFSATGALRIDVDGDGRWSSPRDTARQIVATHGDDFPALVERLRTCNASVVHQAAAVLHSNGIDLDELEELADKKVRQAFDEYQRARQQSLRSIADQAE